MDIQALLEAPDLPAALRSALWLVCDSLEVAILLDYALGISERVNNPFGRRIVDARTVLWGETNYSNGTLKLARERYQLVTLTILDEYGERYRTARSREEEHKTATTVADLLESMVGVTARPSADTRHSATKQPLFEPNRALIRAVVRVLRARKPLAEGSTDECRTLEGKHDPLLELFDVLGVPLGAKPGASLNSKLSGMKRQRPPLGALRRLARQATGKFRVAVTISEDGTIAFERNEDAKADTKLGFRVQPGGRRPILRQNMT
jgi:hypothetical protein